MHGNILNDQIKNYNIQGKLGVTPKKIKWENRLTPFGHVHRRVVVLTIKRIDCLEVIGFFGRRGRPKET